MSNTIPNEIKHNPTDRTVTITVTQRNGTRHNVIVDDFIYQLINGLHIHVNPQRHGMATMYAKTRINGETLLLHRVIGAMQLMVAPPDKLEIDHIDRDPLNCRLSNLRAADRFDQMRNTRRSKSKNVTPRST